MCISNHHFFESGQKLLHLRTRADRYAHEIWQGGEEATDFDAAIAERIENGS